MVGQQPLELYILVRIQVPEQNKISLVDIFILLCGLYENQPPNCEPALAGEAMPSGNFSNPSPAANQILLKRRFLFYP